MDANHLLIREITFHFFLERIELCRKNVGAGELTIKN